MALILSNAILHTITNNEGGSLFSDAELDVDSETCTEFISRHVRRLLSNPGAQEAVFNPDSGVYALVKSYQKGDLHFGEMSKQICGRLVAIMKENEDIPPADILMAAFENSGQTYLAIIKLNYGECFTHRLIEGDSGTENHIVKNTTVLPLNASKVEESCLIPYDPMVLRVMEKPHTVNGEQVNYFSRLFLECETEISKKEAAEIIIEIADEINAKYYGGSLEMDAKIKCALIDETNETGDEESLSMDNMVRRVFEENEQARTEFIDLAKDLGLAAEVKLDKPFVQREFKMQKFKADNGIEIKCPSALFQDADTVQLITNPDGSTTVILKNLRRHVSE